jgi:hypothetical protein
MTNSGFFLGFSIGSSKIYENSFIVGRPLFSLNPTSSSISESSWLYFNLRIPLFIALLIGFISVGLGLSSFLIIALANFYLSVNLSISSKFLMRKRFKASFGPVSA